MPESWASSLLVQRRKRIQKETEIAKASRRCACPPAMLLAESASSGASRRRCGAAPQAVPELQARRGRRQRRAHCPAGPPSQLPGRLQVADRCWGGGRREEAAEAHPDAPDAAQQPRVALPRAAQGRSGLARDRGEGNQQGRRDPCHREGEVQRRAPAEADHDS
eukprot:768685-Hanusia_phi.AAC.1